MITNEKTIEETGLQFFGKLSAAVSHDLKNVLSIINEKAGLLEDFCEMARRGKAIDTDRINTVAAQVRGQVERADQIIRCFNRFAHSADHPIAAADLGEMSVTLVQLAQRLLASLSVSAVVQPTDEPAVITTRPLMAQSLIWACIQWVAAHLGDSKEISIAVRRSDEGACVLIGPVANPQGEGVDAELLAATEDAREALKAEILTDAAAGRLQIQFATLKGS
jgi:light-regulated signal transduction histidine kinase (bacteriophytochrome)